MGRPVTFFEVTSTDPERTQQFYSELFGWTVNTDPGWGGYSLIDTGAGDGAIGGGIGPSQAPGDTGVKNHVRVEDLDSYLARAGTLGGQILIEPTDLPDDFGRFAMFSDPDGNPVGLLA